MSLYDRDIHRPSTLTSFFKDFARKNISTNQTDHRSRVVNADNIASPPPQYNVIILS